MTPTETVTKNSGLKVINLTVTKEGKIERKMPNVSPQAQLNNTLLEALQAGCAIFATDAGDNTALVAGKAGWTGHAASMPAAIEHALAHPDMFANYRNAARLRVAEFSVARMAASTLGHYEAVLQRAAVWPRPTAAVERGE